MIQKRADQLNVGEEFQALEYKVTPDFNQTYLEAVEDYHPRYLKETEFGPPVVHPALLIVQSNVTRSPSFYLPRGVAAVHTHEEIEYLNAARVGKSLRVYWKVVATYEKRGRKYQVKDVLVIDEDGVNILKRRVTDTYVTGGAE